MRRQLAGDRDHWRARVRPIADTGRAADLVLHLRSNDWNSFQSGRTDFRQVAFMF